MLTNCPKCNYSLTGLPDEHACPECAFPYERDSLVFAESRRDAKVVLMISATGLIVSLVYLVIGRRGSAWGGLAAMAVLAVRSAGRVLGRRRCAVVSKRCLWVLGPSKSDRRVAMDQIERTERSHVDGGILVFGRGDRQLVKISPEVTGSKRRTKELATTIDAYAAAARARVAGEAPSA